MVRSSSAYKTAIMVAALVCLPLPGHSQNRQSTPPKLPESRLRIDPADNTVRGVSLDDLQQRIDSMEQLIVQLNQKVSAQGRRIDALETQHNK